MASEFLRDPYYFVTVGRVGSTTDLITQVAANASLCRFGAATILCIGLFFRAVLAVTLVDFPRPDLDMPAPWIGKHIRTSDG